MKLPKHTSVNYKTNSYHKFEYSYAWFKELDNVINFKNKKVLDFGGSWGNLINSSSRDIKQENYTCLDVDKVAISEGMINFPRSNWIHYNKKSIVYNFDGNPKERINSALGDEKYDIIFSYSVFTHMLYEDFVSTIDELKNHLTVDGKIYITICLQQDQDLLDWYKDARIEEGYNKDFKYKLNDSYIYVVNNNQVEEVNSSYKYFLVYYDKNFIKKHGTTHNIDIFQTLLEIK
jgi:predicted SAM-dependent methyltransferase